MPQRNGQNPIRSSRPSSGAGVHHGGPSASHETHASGTVECPACHTQVPPRPGFRLSSLKCPKCGSSLKHA